MNDGILYCLKEPKCETTMEKVYVPEEFTWASGLAPCERFFMRETVQGLLECNSIFIGGNTPFWVRRFIRYIASLIGGITEAVETYEGLKFWPVKTPLTPEGYFFPEMKVYEKYYTRTKGVNMAQKVMVMTPKLPINMPTSENCSIFLAGGINKETAEKYKARINRDPGEVKYVSQQKLTGGTYQNRREWISLMANCTHLYRFNGAIIGDKEAYIQAIAACWMGLYSVIISERSKK